MGRRKKWAIGLAVLVLAGAGIAWWWSRAPDRAAREAPNLTSVRVARGDIEVRLSGAGSVAVSTRESVRPSAAGTVKSVEVKTGDRVKRGQVLATFEGSANHSEIARLELRLEQLRLQLRQAELAFKELQVAGAEASQIERARMDLRSIQLNIEEAELDLEDARERAAGPDPLTAPISGTVTAVNVKPGDAVTPQTEAMVITDYEALELQITVDELDVPKLREGQEAVVLLDALPGRTIRGTVEEISMEGTHSGGVATFLVAIRLESAEQVRPGMSGTAEIVTAAKKDALLLPIEAVQMSGGRYYVLRPASEAGGGDPSNGTGGTGTVPDRSRDGRSGPPPAGESPMNDAPAPDAAPSAGGPAAGAVRFPTALGNVNAMLVPVEIGLYDESRIEIVSGLSEGDEVLIPRFSNDAGFSGLRRVVMGNPGGPGYGFANARETGQRPGSVPGPGGGGAFPGGAGTRGGG